MARFRLGVRAIALGIVTSLALAGSAQARSEKTLAYPREHAWPTAVRFIVVDESAKILEKDADAGYVLFELRDQGKLYRGSLEVLTVVANGQSNVRFVITLVDRPAWMEIAMLTRLEQKLRAELGSPNPAPSKPRQDPDKPPGGNDEKPAPQPGKDEPKDK